MSVQIIRASYVHTPHNPFAGGSLVAQTDGGLALEGGRIVASGPFEQVKAQYPTARVQELRGGLLIPGMVDLHVHYPQTRIIGGLGYRLLDWLEQHTLPQEARLANPDYAKGVAQDFLQGLLRNGTTTALVFGSHFAEAMEVFFAEAQASGLRIVAGLVLSDRNLRPELHTSPQQAFEQSLALAQRWHGQGKLSYAVTPRFSLSCSEAILEVCQALLQAVPGAYFTSHLNEMPEEIAAVRQHFPWAKDYLHTYDAYGLVNPKAVYAHNVYPQEAELARLHEQQAAVAHCPCSNAFIGSGIFPMQQHLQHGVRFGLGSDVAGGTGFGLLKEGLMAYMAQRLLPQGVLLSAAQLLYLATKAGAGALGLADVGDLNPGSVADLVWVCPPEHSSLAKVLQQTSDPEHALGAVFSMASEADIAQVYVDGVPRL